MKYKIVRYSAAIKTVKELLSVIPNSGFIDSRVVLSSSKSKILTSKQLRVPVGVQNWSEILSMLSGFVPESQLSSGMLLKPNLTRKSSLTRGISVAICMASIFSKKSLLAIGLILVGIISDESVRAAWVYGKAGTQVASAQSSGEYQVESERPQDVQSTQHTQAAQVAQAAPQAAQVAQAAPQRSDEPATSFSLIMGDRAAPPNKQLQVFVDPDCEYCKKLEPELVQLATEGWKITQYPVSVLSSNSSKKVSGIFCSRTPGEDFIRLMGGASASTTLYGTDINCKEGELAPSTNTALLQSLGAKNIPFIIRSSDGATGSGYHSAKSLSKWGSSSAPKIED